MVKKKTKKTFSKNRPWCCIDCKAEQMTTPNERRSRSRVRCVKCGGLLMAKRYAMS